MVKENIIVTSQLGIHLRPAGAMCDAAIKFDSNISFEYAEGKTANATVSYTHLDVYKRQSNLMKIVRRLCDELGKTVILVLHEINYAAFYSDYICAFKRCV